MVLDFLPYKVPVQPRKKLGWIRYVTFVVSLIFVASLFLAHVGNLERIMFWAFIVGNVVYYAVGIILACVYKDNRAFCKYICPVTVFLKPMSYYALVRVTCDKEKCVSCGKCKSICPMNVDVTDNSRKRENGTECILCMECVRNCPKSALWRRFFSPVFTGNTSHNEILYPAIFDFVAYKCSALRNCHSWPSSWTEKSIWRMTPPDSVSAKRNRSSRIIN